MRIPPPNPLTVVLMWISAIFMAVREGAAQIPSLTGLAAAMAGLWSFLPLALLGAAGAITLWRTIFPKKEAVAVERAAPTLPLEAVHGRVFRNERVVLDGKSYTGCTFQNCTLVFNGGETALVDNKLRGIAFASDDPKVEAGWHILQALGALNAPAFLRDDPDGRAPGWGLKEQP